MQSTIFSVVILPLVIFLIMMSLGLTLSVDDFRRLLDTKRPVLVGMLSQLIALPIVGLGLAFLWRDTTSIALGLVLMSACPGGPVSNLIVHTANGNRPLSVTLTAISSVLSFITIPLVVSIASQLLQDEALFVTLPFVQTTIQIAFLTVIPLSIGMFWRTRRLAFAERTQPMFKKLSSYALAGIVILLVIQERQTLIDYIGSFGPPTLLLCLLGVFVGVVIAKFSGLNASDDMTIGVETGMQNAPLAITIALTVLGRPELALLPAAYGLFETPLIWLIALGLSKWWSLEKAQST